MALPPTDDMLSPLKGPTASGTKARGRGNENDVEVVRRTAIAIEGESTTLQRCRPGRRFLMAPFSTAAKND
jgi:hypothetical protein